MTSGRTAGTATATHGLANRLLVPLLRSAAGRLLGRRLAVLEYAGRRTAQPHQLVVQYRLEGRTVHIDVGRADHKTWWRNFETPHPLRLRLAGVDHVASAHVVRDGGTVRVIAAPALVTEADLGSLPEPRAAHVRRSGAAGQPGITSLDSTIHGRIRSGPTNRGGASPAGRSTRTGRGDNDSS